MRTGVSGAAEGEVQEAKLAIGRHLPNLLTGAGQVAVRKREPGWYAVVDQQLVVGQVQLRARLGVQPYTWKAEDLATKVKHQEGLADAVPGDEGALEHAGGVVAAEDSFRPLRTGVFQGKPELGGQEARHVEPGSAPLWRGRSVGERGRFLVDHLADRHQPGRQHLALP